MPRKTKKRATKKRKKSKPGVRLTDSQKARRLDMLAQHGQKNSPHPWTAKRCADALGMKVGTWDAWKYAQTKKAGSKKKRGPGRPRNASTGSIDSLQGLISIVKEIQAERARLRKALAQVQGILEGV